MPAGCRKPLISLLLAGVIVILAIAPALANQNWNEGVRLYQSGKYAQAISQFSKAQQSGFKPDYCFYYQALCYQRLGAQDKAKTLYEHILKYYPQSPAASNAAQALAKLGEADAPAKKKPQLAPVDVRFQITRTGHMVLPIMVNGVSMNMLFDTGAGSSFFTAEQLKSKGIVTSVGTKTRVRGVGGEVAGRNIPLTMQVGPIVRRVNALVQDKSYSKDKWSVPLLGQDFFKNLEYTIDADRKVMRFYPPVGMRAEGVTSVDKNDARVPFKWDGNHIVVIVKVNGRECKMTLDTGCSDVAFSDKHLASYGLTRPVDASSGRSSGVGGTRQAYMFFVDKMSLGPVEKYRVHASCAVHMAMKRPLLGMGFLNGVTFTVDPNRGEIRVRR